MTIDAVVKVGGGLLADAGRLDEVLEAIELVSRKRSLIIVPGGGPFADAVRDVDRQLGLSSDAAHWMAILAMDQYAQLIASRLPDGALVSAPGGVEAALREHRLPVLAPYRWMREADPLPHAWEVTSDSISAWIAGQVDARRLVLVKPSNASGPNLVDPCFDRILRPGIKVSIVAADRIADLGNAIAAP